MKITKTDGPPKDVLYFDEEYKDDELDLSPQDVEDVAEIFKTPLTGSYNWDYTVADNRIKKLFEQDKKWYSNKMLSNVVQQCGRGIRSKQDYCKTYILDASVFESIIKNKDVLPKYFLDRFV